MTPEQKRALAICAMGPTRHEYNLGVLSMLGEADLAIAHQIAATSAELLRQQLDADQASNPHDGGLVGMLTYQTPRSAHQLVLRAKVDDADLRRKVAWERIQDIIDRHSGTAGEVMQDWQP